MHISEPHLKADLIPCMHVVRSYTIFITEANYIIDVFRTLVITVRSKEKASAGSIWNEYMHEAKAAMASRSSGLFLLKKLKLDHIHLTSYSRMRVSLAAQVQ